ncbi:MAG: hemolysin family protein [Solidesulfovibrio sp.]|uniref:hemolysin family protein n=1 Tax=Solidesulfovibrio sp. TaxID=2910990 RepID=UPI002B220FAD|nr:hemolysin family protein [Solidesulfovibrio sp.]MEA4855176.1 hemolysin family protein [Solidesulfovibrio sp.]
MTAILLELGAVLALILVNGFFAMAEMALVASRKARLQTLAGAGNARARLCLKLRETPEAFLSAVQIGITLAGVLASAYGGATLAAALAEYLHAFPALAPYAHGLSLAGVVVPIAVATLVLGELVPKRLGLARPERLAMLAAPVMRALMLASRPAVWALGLATQGLLRLFGLAQDGETAVTEEDIRGLLREGAKHGAIEHAERDIMERLLRVTDRPLDVIMTHRSRIGRLDADAADEDIVRAILDSPHTRFPVVRGDFDEVLGIVRAKDVLADRLRTGKINLRAHLSPPVFLPETMRGLEILSRFRQSPRVHLALVVDEYGDVVGMVTAADVFEDLVGDLPGLAGFDEPSVVRREDGSFFIDAATPMDEVAAALALPRPWPEEFAGATLAGFLLTRLGRIPAIGDTLAAHGATFEIADMDGRRIDRVLVAPQGAASRPAP